jgi:preprotein translocase subunit SecF
MRNIYCMQKSKYWFVFSLILIFMGLFTLFNNYLKNGNPFNLGIDFTGGTSIILEIEKATKEFQDSSVLSESTRNDLISLIRKNLESLGINNSQLTTIDKYLFFIKFQDSAELSSEEITSFINTNIEGASVLGVDFIGPSIGQELQKQAFIIIGVAIMLLLIYITFRFEFWAAISAIVALIHDALIVLGMTAFLSIEVNTAFVAAILTILGYSINDTIVIFDRIRENLKNSEKELETIINDSISQTIPRSINTSLTTLAVLLAIFLFGGSSLSDFSLVLLIGITMGTYSSIFIAGPLLFHLKKLNQ